MKKITLLLTLVAIVAGSVFAQNDLISSGRMPLKSNMKGTKEIASTITSTMLVYIPGTTVDLTIVYDHVSPDDEYTTGISMTFPSGVTVNSAEDAGSGATPETWNSETGDGVETTWGTTDGTSSFGHISDDDEWLVNISIDAGFSGDLTVLYTIVGDGYGADPHSISGNFIITEAISNDLAVSGATPSYIFPGNSATPIVTILNNGSGNQDAFDVNLVINDGTSDVYTSTKNITAAGLAGLASMEVTMDDEWTTPENGDYTITATVTLTEDSNNTNDVMNINCYVGEFYEAQAGNTFSSEYGFIDLTDGSLTVNGEISSVVMPVAEEFDGTSIYRIYNDSTYGTVTASGVFTLVGTFSGVEGTPSALAYDHTNELMYVCSMSDSNLPQLCTADMTTGALTLIGTGTEASIIGMDFANNGMLYGPALNDNLYQINTATGELTIIGDVGINLQYGQDVSFDYEDNKLYTITCGDLINEGLIAFGYYDLSTGAFMSITEMELAQYVTFVITNMPSGTTGIKTNNANITSVYPNPSTGLINISTTENSTIKVIDITGKIVEEFTVNALEEINFTQSAGMYIVRVESNNQTSSHKLIIQ